MRKPRCESPELGDMSFDWEEVLENAEAFWKCLGQFQNDASRTVSLKRSDGSLRDVRGSESRQGCSTHTPCRRLRADFMTAYEAGTRMWFEASDGLVRSPSTWFAGYQYRLRELKILESPCAAPKGDAVSAVFCRHCLDVLQQLDGNFEDDITFAAVYADSSRQSAIGLSAFYSCGALRNELYSRLCEGYDLLSLVVDHRRTQGSSGCVVT